VLLQYGSVRVVTLALLLVGGALFSGCLKWESSPLEPSADARWKFTGSIKTVAGANIGGAQLTVLNGPNKDARVSSDASGHYAFEGLQGGLFDVLIEASGFVSITPRVDLYRDIEVGFALSAAP